MQARAVDRDRGAPARAPRRARAARARASAPDSAVESVSTPSRWPRTVIGTLSAERTPSCAQQLVVARAVRRGREVRGVDLRVQLGAPAARDRRRALGSARVDHAGRAAPRRARRRAGSACATATRSRPSLGDEIDHAPVGERPAPRATLRGAASPRSRASRRARGPPRPAAAGVSSACLRSVMSSTTLIACATAPSGPRSGRAFTRDQRSSPVARAAPADRSPAPAPRR